MATALKEAKLGSVRLHTKEGLQSKIPAGAKIIDKKITVNVEEIENGFLICKNYDVKYQQKGKDYNDYCYHEIKIFSETNPLTITEEASGNKSLADLFE